MVKRRIAPVHPGSYLKELLEELRLSQYRLAQDIGVAPMRIRAMSFAGSSLSRRSWH